MRKKESREIALDINKLREELEADEGKVHAIYLDHLNLPTFGIGHLVLDSDPEYGFVLAIGLRFSASSYP